MEQAESRVNIQRRKLSVKMHSRSHHATKKEKVESEAACPLVRPSAAGLKSYPAACFVPPGPPSNSLIGAKLQRASGVDSKATHCATAIVGCLGQSMYDLQLAAEISFCLV